MSSVTIPGGWVDTHVHVFTRGLPFAPARRYQPDYDAAPADLLAAMRQAGVAKAVLVQPSFLGTDNRYLLQAVAAQPDVFAGVAVVDLDATWADLDALRRAGIRGVRLNCIGRPTPDFSRGAVREMAERLAGANLILEIQAEGDQWLSIAPFLKHLSCTILIDHFGRTAPGERHGGFDCLLTAARESSRLWFKFSGPYRLEQGAAALCAPAITAAVGVGRIIWGSDWPATQFEGRHGYPETLRWLEAWVPQAQDRRAVLCGNATRLFDLG